MGAPEERFSIRAFDSPGAAESLGIAPVPTRFSEQRIIILEHGGGELCAEGRTQALKGPWVIMMPKGKEHAFRPDPEARGWVLRFQEDLFPLELRLMYREFFQTGDIRLHHTDYRDRVLGVARCMAAIHTLAPPEEQRAIPHLFYGLLLLLLTKMERKVAHEGSDRPADRRLFLRFLALIEQHGLEIKTIGFYADRLQIPPQRLRAICRKAVDRSPLAIIEDRCIIEAKRLLGGSELTIKEIAQTVGYRDPAYFSRIFLKLTGRTPSEYRG